MRRKDLDVASFRPSFGALAGEQHADDLFRVAIPHQPHLMANRVCSVPPAVSRSVAAPASCASTNRTTEENARPGHRPCPRGSTSTISTAAADPPVDYPDRCVKREHPLVQA